MNRSAVIGLLILFAVPLYAASSGTLSATVGGSPFVGFQGSDWDASGTHMYAAKGRHIYKSTDSTLATWTLWYSLPEADTASALAWAGQTISLMIPDRVTGETTDMMFVCQYGSNKLYKCSDISAETPSFAVSLNVPHTEIMSGLTDGGLLHQIAEDSSGNLYAPWYHLENGLCNLYKSTDRGANWTAIKEVSSRHIHNAQINPHNGWLYMVVGEMGLCVTCTEMNYVMRSKDGGTTWTTLYDNDPDASKTFIALGFLYNSATVMLGHEANGLASTDPANGSIFSLVDDGGSSTIEMTNVLMGVNNNESWWSAITMGNVTYLTSTYAAIASDSDPVTMRCVSTTDGVNFTTVQSLVTNDDTTYFDGLMTSHPNRGYKLIYALDANTGYYISGDPLLATDTRTLSNATLVNGGIR